MTSLQQPPKPEKPSRIVARFFVLVVLLAVVGVVMWTTVTNQRIDLVEDVRLETLELDDVVEVGGLQIRVIEGGGGVIPVVILHDRDVVGGALMEDLAAEIEGRYFPVRIDLPGHGFSSRLPEPSSGHTVAAMAENVVAIVEERYASRPVVVGIGLGGRVAAEMAVTNPDLVRGLVMVDADFWPETTWATWVQGLPFVGEAATFTIESAGLLGYDNWAPNCPTGGWCPTSTLAAVRAQATEIEGTTASLNAFLQTPVSSLVPSDLDLITVPSAYVWSSEGEVPREAVDRVAEAMPNLILTEAAVWKVHLEQPQVVADLIAEVGR